MLRVCVSGGRNFYNSKIVYETLDKFYAIRQDFMIINGGAWGADTLSTEWAKDRNVPYEIFPADWKKYNFAAGPIRNKQMIDSKLHFLIAFPGGNGTRNMIYQCIKNNIRVHIVNVE